MAPHIFVIRHDGEGSLFPFFHHLEQATLNRLKFVFADNASLPVGPGKSNRSKDIFFVKSLVVPNGGIVLVHERINGTCSPVWSVYSIRSLFPKTFEPVNLPPQSMPAAGAAAFCSAMLWGVIVPIGVRDQRREQSGSKNWLRNKSWLINRGHKRVLLFCYLRGEENGESARGESRLATARDNTTQA